MAGSVNRVLLIGTLASAPELRYTPQDVAVCRLHVQTDDEAAVPQGRQRAGVPAGDDAPQPSRPHRVVAVGALAVHAAGTLARGDLVFIEGALRHRTREISVPVPRSARKRRRAAGTATAAAAVTGTGAAAGTGPAATAPAPLPPAAGAATAATTAAAPARASAKPAPSTVVPAPRIIRWVEVEASSVQRLDPPAAPPAQSPRRPR